MTFVSVGTLFDKEGMSVFGFFVCCEQCSSIARSHIAAAAAADNLSKLIPSPCLSAAAAAAAASNAAALLDIACSCCMLCFDAAAATAGSKAANRFIAVAEGAYESMKVLQCDKQNINRDNFLPYLKK